MEKTTTKQSLIKHTHWLNRVVQLVKNHPYSIIAGAYFVITMSFVLYKYTHFLYNMNDLAIFNNALVQPFSHFLYSTIQGHNYFGDHISPYLIIIKFIHILVPSPLTLLVLQTLFIVSGILPIYLLTKKFAKNQQLIIIVLYFFNPATLSINLNEFHMLTLALPLLLFTFYFFQKKQFRYFILLLTATTILREDMFLTIVGFTFLSLLEKRSIRWVLSPLASIGYFIITYFLIQLALGGNSYQFLNLYSWLGSSASEIITNFFLRFDQVLLRFADLLVVEFLLAGLIFFLFIPLYRLRYIIFGIIPYVVLVLGPGKGSEIFKFHYAIPIIFSLILATIYGVQNIPPTHLTFYKKYSVLMTLIVVTSLVYINIMFGPYILTFQNIFDKNFNARVQYQRDVFATITPNLATLSSYGYLYKIPSKQVYALAYAFQGRQQFNLAPYNVPDNLQEIIIDYKDILNFYLRLAPQDYVNNSKNLRHLLKEFNMTELSDTYVKYKRSSTQNAYPLVSTIATPISDQPQMLSDTIQYFPPESIVDGSFLQTRLQFRAISKIKNNFALKITFTDSSGNSVATNYYPLTYGQYPSSLWQPENIITLQYRFHIPITKKDISHAQIQLVLLEGGTTLNNLSTAEIFIEKETLIGKSIPIYSF